MFKTDTESGRPARSEDIGTEMRAGHTVVSDMLDCGPPLGIQQRFACQPVRDGLLADRRSLQELSDTVGESRLAAGDIDSPPQGGNVRFLHKARQYTSFLVGVNKDPCLTTNKEPCTVLQMPAQPREKPHRKARKKRAARQPVIGPDGLTFAQRLRTLMNEKDVGQTEVAKMCSDFYRTFVRDADDVVQQQHIFNVLGGQDSAWCMPLIAAVFDVRELWLQIGIGPRERK
jgi:hypothetical protein